MSRLLPFLLVWLSLPLPALAQRTLQVGVGTSLNVNQIFNNVISYLAAGISFLAITMFMVGAFFIVFSRGEADTVKRGKDLMIGAIVGSAVVLGSYAILRTVLYFVYG